MVIAGREPYASTKTFKNAAPVGVVSSAATSEGSIGTCFNSHAVAGAGTETSPWAMVIFPHPVGTGELIKRSIFI